MSPCHPMVDTLFSNAIELMTTSRVNSGSWIGLTLPINTVCILATLQIRAGGEASVIMPCSGTIPGDVNGDKQISLVDTITALSVASGTTHLPVDHCGAVDGGGVIGIKEAIETIRSVQAQNNN